MLNLSLNELKQIAKMGRIKNYKNMSKERLLSDLDESESAGSGNNFDNTRIKKIREDFNKSRGRILKPKIKETRRNLSEIENKKNLSKSKIKEIEQNLIELKESLFKLNKYYDYDDIEYKGMRDVGNLFNKVAFNGVAFNQSTDEDYYKPIKTNSTFNGNYIEYESKGDQDKNLLIKEYLYIIITHLRDIINDHKAHGKLNIHSSNEIIDYEAEGEWKIHLTIEISFVSSKNSDENRIMHTKDILMGSKTNDINKEIFKSLLQK